MKTVTADFDSGLIFEQDPVQIIDALLPLYLNATLLRALQVRVRRRSAPCRALGHLPVTPGERPLKQRHCWYCSRSACPTLSS